MTIASPIARPIARPIASPLDGSGGGGAPITPWQSLLEDAALIMRLNGDANGDGTGDPTDYKGAYNGTWVGTPTYGTAPTQTNGKAFDTASGRYVTAAIAAMEGLNAWTVCGWTKPRTISDRSSPFFGAVNANTLPALRMSGAKWQCYAWGPTGNAVNALLTNVDVIQVGRWDHIAFTYDGTAAKLIWNGVDVTGTGAVLAGKPIGNNNTILPKLGGNSANVSANAFDGFVSDFRAYSRALTVDEALILATGPTP